MMKFTGKADFLLAPVPQKRLLILKCVCGPSNVADVGKIDPDE
jgi:hypothetical protein